MKASVYEELVGVLEQHPHSLKIVRTRFPHVPLDTLLAILSQEHKRRLRLRHHSLRHPHLLQLYILRYVRGEDIISISTRYDISPCSLVRLLLEHLFGLNKQQISECLRDPDHLPEDRIREVSCSVRNLHPHLGQFDEKTGDCAGFDSEEASVFVSRARLHADLYKCMDNDMVISPYVEMVRRVTGIEYEAYLCRQLEGLGIAFQTENVLRAAGFSKTPDVKLEVPISIRGRVVNWIDSKASFGDESSHKNQADQQFQSYVNRFGSGLVIYWFGFVDELDNHPDILLLDAFPSRDEIYCLPSLHIKPRP